jgi:hypothetical protein
MLFRRPLNYQQQQDNQAQQSMLVKWHLLLKIWKRNTTIYIGFFNVCLGTWILCDLTVVLFSSMENDYPFLFRMFLQSPCFLMFVGVLLVYSVCLVDYNSLLITLLVSWRIHCFVICISGNLSHLNLKICLQTSFLMS